MDLFMVRQCEGEYLDVGKHKGLFTDIEDALVWCITVARLNPSDACTVERVTIDDVSASQEQVFVFGPVMRKTVDQLEREENEMQLRLRRTIRNSKSRCSCCGNETTELRSLPNGNTCSRCFDAIIDATCKQYVLG